MLKAVKKIGVKGVAVLSGRHAFITRLTKPVYIDKKKKKNGIFNAASESALTWIVIPL